ncbi:hypothetical protein HMPREF9406_1046 [Clostridium sp. HGF2]|nr:hypothetical protein HMPREF9406_1046 [Clostridium sp. HGF2]
MKYTCCIKIMQLKNILTSLLLIQKKWMYGGKYEQKIR